MYNNFFGFKEKPFKLVPNPAYLFLSKSHEEALAHLNYAISQGDGFVEITGEVGTGKTTLCRAFLENLDEDTVAAYIFNPKLGPKQLIKSINDEFGIKYDADNTKDLIDKLNAFLMHNKADDKRVIILIDEAQNLSNTVLEQLRLLSNLETTKEKLLQIILVGQPELAQMLDSYELRQIGQRINLRYQISPLNFKETIEYIQYRINIASQRTGVKFDRAAFRHIYKHSRGIPRVINIACDRALLTAYGLNQHRISGNIAKASVTELASRGNTGRLSLIDVRKMLLLAGLLAAAVALGIFSQPILQTFMRYVPGQVPTDTIADSGSSPLGQHENSIAATHPLSVLTPEKFTEKKIRDAAREFKRNPGSERTVQVLPLGEYLLNMDVRSSRQAAIQYALQLWNTESAIEPYFEELDDDQAYFRITAKQHGLSIHRLETDLFLLKNLNLPAILEFFPPGSQTPGYLTLSEINDTNIKLGGAGEHIVISSDPDEMPFYWSGVAYIPWKNFLAISGIIPKNSGGEAVITLKLLLRDIGYNDLELNAEYDPATQQAIEDVQAKYGIAVDGYVGPLTKMILYQEKRTFEIPGVVRQ